MLKMIMDSDDKASIARQILEALSKVNSFSSNQDQTLALLDENGTEVLTLTRNTGEKLSGN